MPRGVAIVALGLFLQGAFVLSAARPPPRRTLVIVESGEGEPLVPPGRAAAPATAPGRRAAAVARRAPDVRVASGPTHRR